MINRKKNLRTGTPLWRAMDFPKVTASALLHDQKADIVIIGVGITGAMVAEELATAGFKVVMLDRRGILKGATSATTALLQYEIDKPLLHLQKQIGRQNAIRAWRRSKIGLESLAAKIQSLGIDCDLKRVPSLYLSGSILNAQEMKEECQLRNMIGLHTDYYTRKLLADRYCIKRSAALLSFDNLSVNPLQLAASLLLHAQEHGAKIFTPVIAEHVEPGRHNVKVYTQGGAVITARHLIYATGYEIPDILKSKRHSVHSTYALATKPQPSKLWPEQCLIWEASDPYLYMRTTSDGRVICGGEDENFTDEEKRDALLPAKIARIEKKLNRLFPQLDCKAQFAWSGCFGASKTGLPSIGAIPKMKNCFAIMAYGGNGITFSRIAAEMLTTQLTGGQDPDADLFAFSDE